MARTATPIMSSMITPMTTTTTVTYMALIAATRPKSPCATN